MMMFKIGKSDFKMTSRFQASILREKSCARISLQKEKCQDLSLGSTNNSQASKINLGDNPSKIGWNWGATFIAHQVLKLRQISKL